MADTHTLVLIFPAETIRKVDAIREVTNEPRVDIISRAVAALKEPEDAH